MDVLKDLYQESHVDMTDFHFLILLRCVRPDTVINALQQYVLNNMGATQIPFTTLSVNEQLDNVKCIK